MLQCADAAPAEEKVDRKRVERGRSIATSTTHVVKVFFFRLHPVFLPCALIPIREDQMRVDLERGRLRRGNPNDRKAKVAISTSKFSARLTKQHTCRLRKTCGLFATATNIPSFLTRSVIRANTRIPRCLFYGSCY